MARVPFHLILASASPRRKQLLKLTGLRFSIRIPKTKESSIKGENPSAMVKRLAALKSSSIFSKTTFEKKGGYIVIGADTVVVSPQGKILGKPKNKLVARKMLALLEGRSHDVYTGYCLLVVKKGNRAAEFSRSVSTKVFFKKMNTLEIKKYVNLGGSLDKAGGYAAQGAGMNIIRSVRGSYSNVIGLPLCEFLDDFHRITEKYFGTR